MPRSARLLALGALLALSCAGAAQAACVADPDYGYGDGSSGCKNCTADGARCETCWEGWGLTKSGECKECLPKLKVDGSMSRATSVCTSCDGDAPDICTACGPFCNTPGCFGYFLPEVKAGVYCTPCPISGCADCKDLTGNCIECRPGLGLVDGECRGCRDEDCKTCDGNLSKCTECRQPKPMFWEGLYLDAAGKCTKCPSGCRECNLTADGKVTCTLCTRTPLDPSTGQCQVACAAPNCKTCLPDGEPPACQECAEGFGLVGDSCVACKVQGCATCDDDATSCGTCVGNATVVNGTACVACPAGCEGCQDPSSCTYCGEGNLTWDAAQAKCVPCTAQGCELCADGSADKCQSCLLGYTLNSATQQCEPVACKVAGCLSCEDDASRCDPEIGCGAGKWYDEASNTCSPCSEGCADCSKFGCGRCSDGYWMDAATRKCNKACVKHH
jgi:hypothetical protein